MEDSKIIDLFWQRDENAIKETGIKYGTYLHVIAYHVLSDSEDSRECVNDTYLKAWDTMPPKRPDHLSSYLGKITRHLAIDRYRYKNREIRKYSEYTLSLSELEDMISDRDSTYEKIEYKLLGEAISSYLKGISPKMRHVFIGRYYYMDSIKTICGYYGMSESKVKSILHRTRKGLKKYLEKEGFFI